MEAAIPYARAISDRLVISRNKTNLDKGLLEWRGHHRNLSLLRTVYKIEVVIQYTRVMLDKLVICRNRTGLDLIGCNTVFKGYVGQINN